jgi:hypothetical protein
VSAQSSTGHSAVEKSRSVSDHAKNVCEIVYEKSGVLEQSKG